MGNRRSIQPRSARLDALISTAVLALLSAAAPTAGQSTIPTGTFVARLEPVTGGLNGVLTDNTNIGRQQLIPIDMTPLGDGRQLIMTLAGHVRLLFSDGTLSAGAYLDTYNSNSPPPILTDSGEITDFRQIGNTSIEAHPGFLDPTNRGYGKFYTITSELPGNLPSDFDDGVDSIVDSVVTEWTVSGFAVDTATQLQPGVNVSKREILRSERPGIVHTLVDMAFGHDETLYLASGDGGGDAFPNTEGNAFGQDRFENSLDPRNVFGSILRIDPLSLPGDTRPTGGLNGQYRIPSDNFGVLDGDPDTLPETFAFGLRSPYRMSVDRGSGELYLGDVGEVQREEINRIENGGNYGWGAFEGTRTNRSDLLPRAVDAVDPLFELFHSVGGQSEATNVVGGFVYRGSAIPELQGYYVFADTGEDNGGQPTNTVDIYYGNPASTEVSSRDDLYRLQIELPSGITMPDRIWSLAEDEAGELYFLAGPDRLDLFQIEGGETDGSLFRLEPAQRVLNGLIGDINQDGFVNGDGTGFPNDDDVSAFIMNWLDDTSGLDAYSQFTNGDLNFDGRTNLADWFLLTQNHINATSLSPETLHSSFVLPEPDMPVLLGTACFATLLNARGLTRRRSRSGLPSAREPQYVRCSPCAPWLRQPRRVRLTNISRTNRLARQIFWHDAQSQLGWSKQRSRLATMPAPTIERLNAIAADSSTLAVFEGA